MNAPRSVAAAPVPIWFAPAGQAGSRLPALLLLGLFSLQALTSLSFYRSAVEPFPPEAYDQASYLARVYELTAAYDTSGLGRLLRAPFEGGAQGVLMAFNGALLEVGSRLGRLSPLLLNFAALLAVEFTLFSTIANLTGRLGQALAALGLFLSAHSMWFWAGGLFDFRIDWIASCLFGIWACIVLRSGVLEDRRWSIASAGIAALLILTRFISATYIFGVEGVLVLLLLVASPWLPTRRRAVNGLIAMAVAGCAVLPFVLVSLSQIYVYYVVGHLTGAERGIRAAEFGAGSLRDKLLYYPSSVLHDHLGGAFGLVLVLFVLTIAVSAAPRRWRADEVVPLLAEILFVAGAIAGPIVVLTADESKSPVVGGIIVVPIVLAVMRLPQWLGALPVPTASVRSRVTVLIGGALCAIAGLGVSLDANATSRPFATRHGLLAWGRMIADVSQDALTHGHLTPKIFFNTLSSHFYTPAFTAYGYERTGVFIRFEGGIGDSIFATEPAVVMQRIAAADYVVLTSAEKVGVYPVLGALKAMDPQLRDWAEHNLRLTRSYAFDGGIVDVYVRP